MERKIQLVDLRAHHDPLRAEIDEAISRVIQDSGFIQGKNAKQFEQSFAEFIGAKHCIGVGNGTDALYVALMGLGIGAGDEVITVANSFIATSEAITQTGAKVVFVDCEQRSLTIDPNQIASAITPRTKAIIPVHLYGQPADMNPILAIARERGLHVIEDAAQAHGARYEGRSVGTLGDCACFSFYPGKNLGAIGDAGALVTSNDQLAIKCRMFANHGRKDKYDHEFEGINSRMDGIQAAVLNIKLKHLNRWNDRRRAIAKQYDEALRAACTIPTARLNVEHVYHLYVVRVEQRDEVRAALQERGIEAGIHYPIPLPLLRAYRYLGHQASDFPVACAAKDQILSLPIHGEMSDEDVNYVIHHFLDIVKQLRVAQRQAA